MFAAVVESTVFNNFWTWTFWIILGGLAGTTTEMMLHSNTIGCAGNMFIGVLGGILGGVVIVTLGIQPGMLFYTFLPAFGSAFLLLFIAQFFAHIRYGTL